MRPTNSQFWRRLAELVETSRIVIDRPRGSTHPRYPDVVYPMDYGYLEGTTTADGGGIDLWRGTAVPGVVTGVVCAVGLVKRDAEIKILLSCTPAEMQTILEFHSGDQASAILIHAPASSA